MTIPVELALGTGGNRRRRRERRPRTPANGGARRLRSPRCSHGPAPGGPRAHLAAALHRLHHRPGPRRGPHSLPSTEGAAPVPDSRDGTCRFPGCTRPATACEPDHTIEWQDGGTTDAGNLAMLCRRHHALKSIGAWTYKHSSPTGDLTWRSPLGREYNTEAAQVGNLATRSSSQTTALLGVLPTALGVLPRALELVQLPRRATRHGGRRWPLSGANPSWAVRALLRTVTLFCQKQGRPLVSGQFEEEAVQIIHLPNCRPGEQVLHVRAGRQVA